MVLEVDREQGRRTEMELQEGPFGHYYVIRWADLSYSPRALCEDRDTSMATEIPVQAEGR